MLRVQEQVWWIVASLTLAMLFHSGADAAWFFPIAIGSGTASALVFDKQASLSRWFVLTLSMVACALAEALQLSPAVIGIASVVDVLAVATGVTTAALLPVVLMLTLQLADKRRTYPR